MSTPTIQQLETKVNAIRIGITETLQKLQERTSEFANSIDLLQARVMALENNLTGTNSAVRRLNTLISSHSFSMEKSKKTSRKPKRKASRKPKRKTSRKPKRKTSRKPKRKTSRRPKRKTSRNIKGGRK